MPSNRGPFISKSGKKFGGRLNCTSPMDDYHRLSMSHNVAAACVPLHCRTHTVHHNRSLQILSKVGHGSLNISIWILLHLPSSKGLQNNLASWPVARFTVEAWIFKIIQHPWLDLPAPYCGKLFGKPFLENTSLFVWEKKVACFQIKSIVCLPFPRILISYKTLLKEHLLHKCPKHWAMRGHSPL